MYEDLVKNGRKQVAILTIQQMKEVNKIYSDALKGLSNIAKQSNTPITASWQINYLKQVEKAKQKLIADIAKSTYKVIKQTADIGVNIQKETLKRTLALGGIEMPKSFNKKFEQANNNTVRAIVTGKKYGDNKSITNRVVAYGNKFTKDIKYMIDQAEDSEDLADGLNEYSKPPQSRSKEWMDKNPMLVNALIMGAALTLVRTTTNHAYQSSTVEASSFNPFVEGIEWSTQGEGACDECERLETEDSFGLGPGIFPVDQVPDDHPNGVCTMIPYIIKSSSQVADELRRWVPGDDSMLDNWDRIWNDN